MPESVREGDHGRARNQDRVEEQSQKDEMRAALQGDFERMRRRQTGEGEPVALTQPAAVRAEEPEVVLHEAPSGSWLDRLLGRA